VGIKYVFLFSLSIEFTQLFFRLGTFQLSDLFYNTLGGLIGALLYWLFYRLNKYIDLK
ncbi:TPA: VanZ family protein, partial [Enterococcus faecium]